MSELNPETAEPAPEAQPTVQPEEVTPEVFNAMYAETATGGEFPLDTQAEEDTTDNYVDDVGPVDDLQSRLDQLQSRVNQQDAYIQGMGSQQQQGNQPAPPTVEEQVRANNPDLSEPQAKWLAENVRTIAGPMMQGMNDQIQYLSNRQHQTDQNAQVANFDDHVDRLMDSHSIEDPWTRRVMRHAIVNEGIEKHGNAFSNDLATREFINLNNERLERAQDTQEAYVTDKHRAADETPPLVGPASTQTAVQGIREQVRDPKNRGMDFRGDTMTDMVSGYLEALEKKTDGALGG